jgi:rRNA-processing protein FCF1
LFFQHNTALGPPYRILVDTNFINFSLQNKIELVQGMMDCLYAKSIPCITDCVLAELEKLGPKYRIALRVARDPRFERLPCSHKGTYADDCIIDRISTHKCYMVATCDRELRRRVRKVPVSLRCGSERGLPLDLYLCKLAALTCFTDLISSMSIRGFHSCTCQSDATPWSVCPIKEWPRRGAISCSLTRQ